MALRHCLGWAFRCGHSKGNSSKCLAKSRALARLRAYTSCSSPSFGTLTVIVMVSSRFPCCRDIVTTRLLLLTGADGAKDMCLAIGAPARSEVLRAKNANIESSFRLFAINSLLSVRYPTYASEGRAKAQRRTTRPRDENSDTGSKLVPQKHHHQLQSR